MSAGANIVAFMAGRRYARSGGSLWPLIIIAVIVALLIAAFGPAQTYDFSTAPYVHTQSIADCMTYSGNSCIQPQQWGFIDVDPVAHAFLMETGVVKPGAGFQTGKITISGGGDCWQSGTQVAATAGGKKWVLVIGTPPMCADSGQPAKALAVQVWKWENQTWVWKGQVGSNVTYPRTPLGKVGIHGDTGYVRAGDGSWSSIDLASLTITQTGIPAGSLSPLEDQQGINGQTWALTKIGNPALYRLAVVGPVLPTITPGGPTWTPTKTATKTPMSGTPSKTPTIDPCGPVPNCKSPTPSPWRTATTVPTSPPPTFSKTPTPASGCGSPSSQTLCLAGRFRVSADWTRSDGSSGHATAIPLTTDTGAFWFFTAGNYEVIVKVLNGCTINAKWWAFGAGLTNVKVDWTVTDTTTGVTQTYHNGQGNLFQPVADTAAFVCP